MIIVCKYCGKEFEGRKGTKYCCNNCRYQYRYGGVIKGCKYCGKEFNGKDRKVYCSTKCSVAYNNAKRHINNPHTERECHCGTKFISNNHRIYCSAKCRIVKYEELEKLENNKTLEKFRNTKFKEYEPTDIDNIFVPIRNIGYSNIKLKAQMYDYGVNPVLKKIEVNTIRGIRRLKICVTTVEDLIKLYNIKIEKFREHPHMNVKNTVVAIGAIIEKIRKEIKNEETKKDS